MVIDKGLMDALLCNDGWDGLVEKLLTGIGSVLDSEHGTYLLVSYKLGRPTKKLLEKVGVSVGLNWEFDVPPLSNAKVSVSLARKHAGASRIFPPEQSGTPK